MTFLSLEMQMCPTNICYDSKGTLWVSSGLNVFKISTTDSSEKFDAPTVYLSNLIVNNKPLLTNSNHKYSLKYYENNITIEVGTLDCAVLTTPNYWYKIIPADTNWQCNFENKRINFFKFSSRQLHYFG